MEDSLDRAGHEQFVAFRAGYFEPILDVSGGLTLGERFQPKTERDEASLLLAFDTNRTAIFAAAIKAYKQGRKGSYELGATDF